MLAYHGQLIVVSWGVACLGAADRYLGSPPLSHVDTGDAAFVDSERIVLAGRVKDMILRGAENVYPGLYEPALHVPGVDLAVLVGVPAGDEIGRAHV